MSDIFMLVLAIVVITLANILPFLHFSKTDKPANKGG